MLDMNYGNYGKVAVIMGGDSPEREISLIGGDAVFNALQRRGVDVHKFDYAKTPITQLITQKFDRAFIMVHGHGGEDGTLQGVLEFFKIPYTGSAVSASSLAMDKYRTKLIWSSLGIPVAKSQYITKENYHANGVVLQLPLPVIVKPNNGGSTLDMTIVYKIEYLDQALATAFLHDDAVLVEELIIGTEYTAVVSEDRVYPIIKIEPPENKDTYDYQDKYFTNDTQYTCPFNFGEKHQQIEEYIKLAYQAIGARGVARVDFMQSHTGHVYFLEINTIPGMTNHSFVPMAFRAVGIDFDELCLYILSLAKTNSI